jgi:hypothetical protein
VRRVLAACRAGASERPDEDRGAGRPADGDDQCRRSEQALHWEWDDHHVNPGAEPVVLQHACGAEFHPLTVCAACREPLRDGKLTVTGGTHPVEATM